MALTSRNFNFPLTAAVAVSVGVLLRRYAISRRYTSPPVAKEVPHEVKVGDHTIVDPYYWMRDDSRSKKEIIEYLEHENKYTDYMTKYSEKQQKDLYEELLSHLKEDDSETPYPWGDFFYYKRNEKGLNYPIYCRKARKSGEYEIDSKVEEEVVLDVNKIAQGHEHFALGAFSPSPDHTILAYTYDTKAYETYDLKIVDIKTGKVIEDTVTGIYGSLDWGGDNKTVYYTTMDAAHRPYRIYRHIVGTKQADDKLIFEELNDLYRVYSDRALSGRFLFVKVRGAVTSEAYYIDLKVPDAPLTLIQKRQEKVLYRVEHSGDYFWIMHNDEALNFKLVRTPTDKPGKENWETILAHSRDRYIERIDAFANHLVVSGRRNGLTSVEILDLKEEESWEPYLVPFDEKIYTVEMGRNEIWDLSQLRLSYSSMTTPAQVLDFELKTKKKILRKEKPVLNFHRELYASERREAKAKDETKVPIILVYKKSTLEAESKDGYPVLLIGYGSYGISYDPEFDFQRLPLLDRGVVIALAHIRGGGEMGRHWYENGKYLDKKNTFTDFIAVAEHLIDTGFTTKDKLMISGGSAGGLLMGAVLNLRPDLFRGCYTRVPFVDVVVTMSDASIPLTAGEWEEWGNPNTEKYFDYMRSYSPIDNVKEQAYPAMLVTTGLHDSRVGYWEPMKWVAKLRSKKTDKNIILLKCKMVGGHGGATGRYAYLEEKAFEWSWILNQLGIKH